MKVKHFVLWMLFFLSIALSVLVYAMVGAQEDEGRPPVEYRVGKLEVVPRGLLIQAVIPRRATLEVGKRLYYQAMCDYSDGRYRDCTAQMLWSSSRPTVATVSVTGVATAIGIGGVDIIAQLKPVYYTPLPKK